ncbi:TetR family transcriptional regulator [Sinomonas cellulolyticus]|uniref:TetR/AcrR family transcriptional regulator n=1 Tax=Sinomonas cellulolyticus TaxID=2801916 RepID=UPI0019AAAD9E|nr:MULTISPECIES: TetR/AcrR family transcriptional regulator [Sinomonas]GHG50972.1 TetR family transcriptional regulator [Sinomonas sp. KCTC 49339]
MEIQERIDGRRARGEQSRRAVLVEAVDLASVEGLEGLTIGRLATAVGASKSGVGALFGTKEGLQLATVEAARQIFVEHVITAARGEPRGLRRLCAVVRLWLDYSRRRVFAGGCFFQSTAVEFDARPGPVRDALAAALRDWDSYLAHAVQTAMDLGELPGLHDAAQLAFEIDAVFNEANNRSLLLGTDVPYGRARAAIEARLAGLGADPSVLAVLPDVGAGG